MLAPADPSGQDRKVAASASASVVMGEARAELQFEEQDHGGQVVEQAGQRIVAEAEGRVRDGERASAGTGGSYQRGQYQRAAASAGRALALGM